ncbi:MAG: TlpA family protein disulfide reductase [Dysgonamonadaceae bacterium]|jgi:thiol-disulfide isomerase/thioredoxin|nr:TlpA family protein disulfide reductase [Dysgonamonadaceae bacterium]
MKHLLVSFLLWASLSLAVSAGTIVVERPSFVFNTHSNVSVERIVLNESSTILDMLVSIQQGHWIRIASDSYINADGKKYLLQSADGIQLDAEVYPDESEKIFFSLIFPPVDPDTKQIDFIESDCDNCFKTFGLALNQDAAMQRAVVPQKIKDAAIVKDDGKPLPVPQLKPGKAVLKGTLLEYVPAINTKVNIYVNNPITGIQEEHETKVKEDGSFELEIPLITTMQVLLRLSSPWYNKYILLSPGKTSTVYFDLPQKSCQETPIKSLKCSPGKYIYFGGANAEINNQVEDINLGELLRQIHSDQNYDRIAEMTPGQYKSYVLDKVAVMTAGLEQKGLSRKALDFASGSIRYTAANDLMFTRSNLSSAFRKSHKLDYDAPELQKFTQQELDADFYSFLKEAPINDPYFLYYHNCSNIINSCKYLDAQRFRINYTSKDTWQALINTGKLLPEEMEVALYLRNRALDNPAAKELLKSNQTMFIREVMNTGKLNEEQLEEANRILSLYADTSTTAQTALKQSIMFSMDLAEKGIFTHEELNNFRTVIDEQDTEFAKIREQIKLFSEKYRKETEQMTSQIVMKEKQAALIRILGTNEGIAPDLLETQLACAKMEEFIPLTDVDLQPFSKKKNRFYFNYLTAKNKELLAQIEEKKRKGNYTIHETPETDGEQAFSEIVKSFEGKVMLIDFWNTWCGPCRSAMKKFEPSKNALKEKGIVFIYLADESSPVSAWNNMIPDIPGEHFRLRNSQMDELKKKFGFNGIPSYLILNKQGEQIYFKTGFDGDTIKRILTEAL